MVVLDAMSQRRIPIGLRGLHQRRTAAVSFASQAGGLALMLLWPASPAALYLGGLVFGPSVGNVVTLPSLIVQRELRRARSGW